MIQWGDYFDPVGDYFDPEGDYFDPERAIRLAEHGGVP